MRPAGMACGCNGAAGFSGFVLSRGKQDMQSIQDKNFLRNHEVDCVARTAKLHTLTMKTRIILTLAAILPMFAAAHAASLEVDKGRSRIQVDAKATGHKFTGTLKDYTVTVSGDAASLAPQAFELAWSFKDLDTDDAKRDKQMIEWLGGADPKGSFKFTKSWTGKDGAPHGTGTLTIHGVSKEISFPYTVTKDGDWVTIDGKVAMDYQNFKLPVIRAMAVMTVDPQLVVRFHVVGKVK